MNAGMAVCECPVSCKPTRAVVLGVDRAIGEAMAVMMVPGVKITGDVTYNGQRIFDAEVNNLRKEVGMVFQKPNPFPMNFYDNIAYGHCTHGITNKAQLDDIVEKALRGAAVWDEVKDCQ